jgi:DNA-binding CsgD family transcriptional regulator
MGGMTTKNTTLWWANTLLYGLSLGLLLAALQFSEYRLLILNDAVNWYMGLIATVFASLGIWAGLKLNRSPKKPLVIPEPAFQPKDEVLERLGITPRELEVLEQMALGLSNQEIADKLFVSLNTIKTHSSNLFSKLGVQRRTQAIQKATALGLI